jgi:hypothetical protein
MSTLRWTFLASFWRKPSLFILPILIGTLSLPSCKSDNGGSGESGACSQPFQTSISSSEIRGSGDIYFLLDQLAFLSDPHFILENVELKVKIESHHSSGNSNGHGNGNGNGNGNNGNGNSGNSGNNGNFGSNGNSGSNGNGKGNSKHKTGSDRDHKKEKEKKTVKELSIDLNGIKAFRRDGRPLAEVLESTDTTTLLKIQLHKLYLNGATPFNVLFLKLKQNKGKLKISLHGRDTHVIEASLVFSGKKTDGCTPPPDPTPTPVAVRASLDSVIPSENPTMSTSVSFSFSSNVEGSSFYCSLDGSAAELCDSPKAYSGLLNGNHVFSVYAQDPRGNASAPVSYSWSVNAPMPAQIAITNLNELPTLTNSSSMGFEFAASYANSFMCSLDGAAPSECSSPIAYTGLSEGAHSFSVYAVNNQGQSESASFQWTIDMTPPLARFVSISPAELITNRTSSTFTFSANETSTFHCSFDNGPFEACVSPVTVEVSNEGSHWFEIRATDAAGNVGTPASYAWNVDTTPPVISVSSVVPALGMTNAKSVSVEYSSDEQASFSCLFDGIPMVPCSSPFTTEVLTEGAHILTIFASDTAGNAANPVTLSWTMDFTAPVISFAAISPSGSYVGSNQIQFDVNSSKSSVLEVNLNGVRLAQNQSPIFLSGLAEGSYTLSVVAVDSVGNVSNTISHSFTVDLTAPSVTLAAEKTASPLNSDRNAFSFSADEPATFECNLDGVGFESCASPVDYAGLGDGAHLFQVRAKDLAGHSSEIEQYEWVVDTRAPATSVVANQTSDSSVTFTLSADESGVTYVCSMDDAPEAPCQSPISYSSLTPGSHVFIARAIDSAGNIDTVGASFSFAVFGPIHTSILSVSITSTPTNSKNIQISFGADQPNATYLCSLDGAPLAACVSPITYSGLGDGNHSFTAKAIDRFGSVDTVGATYSWKIDTVAPIVFSFSTTSGTNSVTLNWVTDEPSTSKALYGIGTSLNQSTAENTALVTSHTLVVTGLSSNTTYSFQVTGRDAAGNVYSSAVKTAKTNR